MFGEPLPLRLGLEVEVFREEEWRKFMADMTYGALTYRPDPIYPIDPAPFKMWLEDEENRDRKLLCGNSNRCAVAQYIADTHGEFPAGATQVLVKSNEVMFVSAPSADAAMHGSSDIIEEYRLPLWAQQYIQLFDLQEPWKNEGRPGTVPVQETLSNGDQGSWIRPQDAAVLLCKVTPEVC